MMYLVLFLLIRLNYYHRHHHRHYPMHQFLLTMDLVVPVVVDVERKIDYDDEMKNIEMENKNLMEDDPDLLEMIDKSLIIIKLVYGNLLIKTYRVEDDSSSPIVLFDDGETLVF